MWVYMEFIYKIALLCYAWRGHNGPPTTFTIRYRSLLQTVCFNEQNRPF